MKNQAKIAVIGGSGVYNLESLSGCREISVKTPFGPPSGKILLGELKGVLCAFLPRHGKGHSLLPSEINARANLYALKSLGVERLVSVSAVGSLKEEFEPRHFAFPDQIVDETKGRISSFFGNGIVAHIAFDVPFCQVQSGFLFEAAQSLGISSHRGGTYVCMEGPAFSTRAESEYHRKMGYSIIGMTAVPEAKLAREAEICYSLVALVTDYDCWKQGEEVSAGKIMANIHANVANAKKFLEETLPALSKLPRQCRCAHALSGALVTAPKAMPSKTVEKLGLLIGKYFSLSHPTILLSGKKASTAKEDIDLLTREILEINMPPSNEISLGKLGEAA
jgi:5'-methylthioadenosine phosphorylase